MALEVLETQQVIQRLFPHTLLSLAHAHAGHSEVAIQEALFAVAERPILHDARVGPELIENLARVYVLVGDYESAIEQLEIYSSVSSSVGPILNNVLSITLENILSRIYNRLSYQVYDRN